MNKQDCKHPRTTTYTDRIEHKDNGYVFGVTYRTIVRCEVCGEVLEVKSE